MQTTEQPRFKQVTVNLDAITIERCHQLAIAKSTTVSGLLRLLAANAFKELQEEKEAV
jgi:hypothetical protein